MTQDFHLEIHGGVVSKTNAVNGPKVGDLIYTVELVGEEGGRFILWDGSNHPDAAAKGKMLADDFGVELFDEVGANDKTIK
jgi:hypothetical protein